MKAASQRGGATRLGPSGTTITDPPTSWASRSTSGLPASRFSRPLSINWLDPLGFVDFDPLKHARFGYDPDAPRFPAYNPWLSARDVAKFGQLYLQKGHRQGDILPGRLGGLDHCWMLS